MKKLLYSGLTALMMLFAVGTAKADLPKGTEEDASVFTFSPANGSTVASGALLTITAVDATEIAYYAFATEAEADAKLESQYWNWMQGNDYADGKPAITEDARVFMVAAYVDGVWKYTRVSYTIETGDIANPKIYVNGQDITKRRITEADTITMDVPGNSSEDIDIWYTTDGTTPAANTGTKYTGKFTLTAGEVELKVIAVNSSNQTSSVVTVQFTVVTVASTTAQLYLMTTDNVEITDNTYGRYVSFLAMPMVQGEDGLEPAGDHAKVYYTVDGTTEPSVEGYLNSDEEEGPVFLAAYGIDSYDGAMKKPYITLTENSTTLKVFAVAEDESGNERTTEVKTYDMTAIAVTTPSFDTPEGKVTANAVVKVPNAGNYARIYYTTDGSVPAYSRTRDWYETAVKLYEDETGIVIKKTTTINIIAYTADDNGKVKAGSDMITATYTVEEQGGDEAVYGLVAVGATETTDEEANTFMQFTTPEPQFTITVPENAPEGWYATVVAYSIDPFGAVEGQTDTLRAGNATKTFSTLTEGTMYLCRAFVRDANNKKLWNNPGADGDGGLLFKIVGSEDPEDPTFTVTAAGKNEFVGDTVYVFDGVATFKMKAEGVAEGKDTNYQYKVDIYDAPDAIAPIDSKLFPVTDTIAELAELYNGEYTVEFYLETKGVGDEWNAVGTEQSFDIKVTNYAAPVPVPDPTLTVTAAGKNEFVGDTVYVFDGNAAFRMKLEAAEGDTTTYKIMAQLFSKEAYDTMGEAITIYSYDATDTIAEFTGVYNGEYAVHFYAEKVYTLSGEPEEVGESTDFYVNVTNNEEPVENDEFTVEPVGATKEGENYTFTAAEVAFDMFVKGMTEADSTLLLYATIYTKAQYEDFDSVGFVAKKAADSVRFAATLENGEYVGVFQLMRKGGRDTVATNAEDVTIKFTVKADSTFNEAKELAGVSIYPNPTDGEFNVVAPANANVEIFNVAGVLVKRMTVAEGNAQVRLDNSGIYFVRVRVNGQAAIRKVVVR